MYKFSEFTRLASQVKLKIDSEMWNYKGSNLCLMETSHRSPVFAAVNTTTNDELRGYLAVPPNYKILLMQGGAELVWASIAYNLFLNGEGNTKKAAYITTGPRSQRAAEEAGKAVGHDNIVRGGASILLADKTVDYLYSYFCMNDIENCCYTTALKDDNSTLKVADCSSVLGLHPIDISQYSIVFGSAEHSIGITGCTIVIIREELIKANIKIPSMFSFEVMLRTNSIFNTPNCFAVYVLGENVKYLKQAYGAPEKAQQKLKLLHDQLLEELTKQSSPFAPSKYQSYFPGTIKLTYTGNDEKHIESVSSFLELNNLLYGFSKHRTIYLQLINTTEEVAEVVRALTHQQLP